MLILVIAKRVIAKKVIAKEYHFRKCFKLFFKQATRCNLPGDCAISEACQSADDILQSHKSVFNNDNR